MASKELCLQGERKLVKEITKGGFFGEVALVTKSAIRVADCIAKTRHDVQSLFYSERDRPPEEKGGFTGSSQHD